MDMAMEHERHGTFAGHLFPGISMMIVGLWWLYQTCSSWSASSSSALTHVRGVMTVKPNTSSAYKARAWYPGGSKDTIAVLLSLYAEPLAKIILPGLSALGEMYNTPLFNVDGRFNERNANNW